MTRFYLRHFAEVTLCYYYSRKRTRESPELRQLRFSDTFGCWLMFNMSTRYVWCVFYEYNKDTSVNFVSFSKCVSKVAWYH